ncbi:MAG: hypothetical protein JJE30_04035 [Desulfuromonadales bacterium]|nr:hypothetical protein [Desulfuromonadales bacterium]
MRANSNIRKVFYDDLLDKPKTISQQKYLDAMDYLFPLKTYFQEFLTSSSDEQVENTKKLIDLISFENTNSPPSFLHRIILTLQKEQQSSLKKKARYSRDHVRHIIYLYFIGVLLYSKTVVFNSRIDKEIKDKKRQFSVHTDRNSYAIFSELWSQFSIYHDIGYPIEELSDDDLKPYILQHVVGAYKNYHAGLKSKFSVALVSNLISIIALIKEQDSLNFGDRIYKYIDKDEENIIKASFSVDEINNLLMANSYSNVSSDLGVKLLSAFINAKNIFVIVEDNETSKIINVETYDNYISKAANRKRTKVVSSTTRYFFYGNVRGILEELVQRLFGANGVANLDALTNELIATEKFKDFYTSNAEICNNMNSMAFVTLFHKEYMTANDFFSPKEQTDLFCSASESYKRLGPSIIDEFTDAFNASFIDQIVTGDLNLKEVLNSPNDSITRELIFKSLHFEKLAKKITKDINTRTKKDPKKQCDEKEIYGVMREWISKEKTFRSIHEGFGSDLLPKIRRDIAANESLHNLLHSFEANLDALFSQTLSKCILVTAFLEFDFETTPLQVLTLYNKLKDTILVKEKVIDEVDEYIERVNDYNPPWKNDHGFVSALYYLATVEFNFQLLKEIQENTDLDNDLLNLMFFIKDNKDINSRIQEIKFQASICFPAIFYHNYYPSYAQKSEFREYKNNFHKSPFTYIAVLADSLQNWGRDTNYNPGIANLTNIKPENYYDIEFKESKIFLYVNSKYVSEEEIIKLRKGLKEYLQDIDALLDIKLCEFRQSFIA